MFHLLGNDTLRHDRHWTPNSDARGTWSIIWTCLVTRVLCLWVALHQDVPAKPQTIWQSLFWKWTRCLLGILCPEWLAYKALSQLIEAQICTNEYRKCSQLRDEDRPTDDEKRPEVEIVHQSADAPPEWTLTHSFLAVSGGFALPREDNTPPACEDLAITPIGWLFIFRHCPQFIPSITSEEIQERSSNNKFVNFLACVQIIFLVIDLIIRLSARYGVSLLEVNVFAHCIFALGIYICWWYKPRDVKRPIILEQIRGTGYTPLIHYCSQQRSFPPSYDAVLKEIRDAEATSGEYNTSSRNSACDGASEVPAYDRMHAETKQGSIHPMLWLKLGLEQTQAHEDFKAALEGVQPKSLKEAFLMRFFSRPAFSQYAVYLSILVLYFPYGLVHFLGWNLEWPRIYERHLWRISVIVLLAIGPMAVVLCPLLWLWYVSLEALEYKQEEYPEFSVLFWLIKSIILILGWVFLIIFGSFIAYAVARSILVVESFIQLGFLPSSVFAVTPWARYFPHL